MTDRQQVAWVTGAGKGIGRAVARKLAQDNWRVAVSARTRADLDSLAAECPAGSIEVFPVDITDRDAIFETVAAIEATMGPLALTVLNAGTHAPMQAVDFDIDAFRKLCDVNLMGNVHCLGALMPRFIERGRGTLAVVASVAGYRGLPTSAAYGATKAGLINMCEALQPDLARHGVDLKLINPGFVETPLTDRNEFPMPFLITAERAADAIVKGLKGRAFEIAFPWRFAVIMKLMRLLPNRLLFSLTRRMIPE
ncbi:SDR family NAD(P)-dependent oxidoreductase [Rhodospirillaceae bacterium KN72]|uniref:SDR family NAD(P)-dependent oxidoreductase n=1 Tax=Pacificispira spongiicola TaxID=2729598 RepID=A0A7Y0DXD4_9PROT|nr:SDR family NAD(P)-dependent oxidoreductase [Pacificispira spongiicola]NMM43364.1 SDR family NAD(P)-dependent oxidoreductase [Pacificispira spongiicola]